MSFRDAIALVAKRLESPTKVYEDDPEEDIQAIIEAAFASHQRRENLINPPVPDHQLQPLARPMQLGDRRGCEPFAISLVDVLPRDRVERRSCRQLRRTLSRRFAAAQSSPAPALTRASSRAFRAALSVTSGYLPSASLRSTTCARYFSLQSLPPAFVTSR